MSNNEYGIELETIASGSLDPDADRVACLRELFPEAVTEGGNGIDFDRLRELLGDHTNESSERYAFTWPGKRDAIRQSQTTSDATLRPNSPKAWTGTPRRTSTSKATTSKSSNSCNAPTTVKST